MKLRLLTDDAYSRISKLQEVLHKENRGHAIVTVEINDLIFALPLRSNLKHKHGFKTIFHEGQWNGIDYSKAVLVTDSDLQQMPFKPRCEEEYKKIKRHKYEIISKFTEYLTGYINFEKSDPVKVQRRFGYTTLVNYHKELGIQE